MKKKKNSKMYNSKTVRVILKIPTDLSSTAQGLYTVKTYLTHINSIQKFMGFKKFDQNIFNLKTLLDGFKNGEKILG